MADGQISIKQMRGLLVFNIFGASVIALPRMAAELAENDGWLLIIGGTLIALIYVFTVNKLASMFPLHSFADYSRQIAGPLGLILSMILAGKLMFTAGMELRLLSEIVKEWMLFQTPVYVTSGAMTALCVYASLNGYSTRARLSETLIYIVFVPIFIIFLSAAVNADFTNLFPVFTSEGVGLLTGSLHLSFAFRAVVFALVAYPLINNPVNAKKGQAIAVIFSGAVLLLFTATTLARFGVYDVKDLLWPLLQIMDAIDISIISLRRMDAFVLSFWVVSSFVSVSAGVFFSSYIVGGLFKGRGQNAYIAPCGVFIFVTALMPANVSESFNLLNLADLALGSAYLFFVPLLLIVIAKARGLGKNELGGGNENDLPAD